MFEFLSAISNVYLIAFMIKQGVFNCNFQSLLFQSLINVNLRTPFMYSLSKIQNLVLKYINSNWKYLLHFIKLQMPYSKICSFGTVKLVGNILINNVRCRCVILNICANNGVRVMDSYWETF